MNRYMFRASVGILLAVVLTGCGTVRGAAPPVTQAPPTPSVPPLPTATSIPGWTKFEGAGIAMWLPESFQGGDLSKDVDVIVETLKRLGPDFDPIAQQLEQNPSLFVLWVFDTDVGESGFLTSAAVTKERVLSAMTVDTYLDLAVKQFPDSFQIVDRSIVSLDHYQAGRLLVDFTISNVQGKEVIYVIKEGDTVWVITFATGESEFEGRLPDFERSANTVVIQP